MYILKQQDKPARQLVGQTYKFIRLKPQSSWTATPPIPPDPPDPPEPPTPTPTLEGKVLLVSANPQVGLLANENQYLLYTQDYPGLLISDTLSNKNIGTAPYSVSFQISQKAFENPTYLLNIPGLALFYTDTSYVYVKVAWDNVIYSIAQTYLLKDWNTITLSCTGDKVILGYNDNQTTLVDATNTLLCRRYTGFASNKYFKAKEAYTLTATDTYKFIYSVSTTTISTTQPIMAQDTIDRSWYMQGSSHKISYYTGSATVGKTVWEANKDYWVQMVYDGTNVKTYLAEDDLTKTAAALPDVSDTTFWSEETTHTTNILEDCAYRLGCNGGSNAYWRGYIDLGRAYIQINDDVVVNGTNWADFYDMVGELTYTDVSVGPVIPEINTGQLHIFGELTKLNSVQASTN